MFRQGLRRLGLTFSRRDYFELTQTGPHSPPPARALAWIQAQELPTGGIRVHSAHSNAYPEVTGYLIPTLLEYGERELATRLIRWLICIQRADGSYTSSNGVPYVFDTGQALRGLLAGAEHVPAALNAARRAADYLCQSIIEKGSRGFIEEYSGTIAESVHLYVLPALWEAAKVFQESEYQLVAEKCFEYYCGLEDFLQIENLTHFLGYELEALIDLDSTKMAIPVLNTLRNLQEEDGSVRAESDKLWICTPGLAQLAICWYKVGEWEPADKAVTWLEKHQQPNGGFLGSMGSGATYFPNVELSWSAKFYLDAHLLRVRSFFDRNSHIFPAKISSTDCRAKAIVSAVKPDDRVLEVGCGKGRFLRLVHESYPSAECVGIDISPVLLEHVPQGIRALKGSQESIPFPDNDFDVVFSVEALEHSANPEAAISEMIRVTRPGGWTIVIDKQRSHWGRLSCPSWERWPEVKGLSKLLDKGCDNVTAEPIGYDGKQASDGLMVLWRGQKRCQLSGPQWNEKLISPTSKSNLVQRLKRNQISEWAQIILLSSSHGEKVLEIGSGTGEISMGLALAGRIVTALDFSLENLEFMRRCADELGIAIETVVADVTRSLPFSENEFDCTWSSGLLEHFTAEQRRNILREQARIARKKVIALVPNASCVAYRAGKTYQEKQGTWPYGLETPILSLREDFEAVGLRILSEYSIGAEHALSFLPAEHLLRKALASWIEGMSSDELRDCNQGYLLVTIGSKSQGEHGC